ncbi:MAG: TolC family protein [Vicinamibacterales bacterium]
MRKTVRLLAAASFVFASTFPAIAQDNNLEHVRALMAQAQAQGQVQQPATQSKLAPVAQTGAPFQTAGPRVDLGIEEAVQRAMDKNIDIAVARITPRLTDFSIAGLEANYRVNLTSSLNNTNTTDLPRLTTQGISAPTTSIREAWSAGIAQNLWKGGGNYGVSWTNSRLAAQSAVNLRNPQFQSGITASLTQPLLRGFRIDATRAALRTNRLSQENDEISLTSTTATTAANARNAYWDLVYALGAVEAAQNSLDLANRLVQDNQSRVEIGTLAPIDVVSAQAESASRRNTLVTAQAAVRTTELALKRLIVSGPEDPLWTSSINPVDRPSTAPEPINIEAAVARALGDRTDLQQSKNNLKISDINLQTQVDATRPQLNLAANYGLQGLGGPFLQRTGAVDPITGGAVSSIIPSGYLDALRNISGFDAPTWTLGLTFAFPLGASAQEATVARSKLSLRQTEVNLKALELQIATDVMNAGFTVQSSLESVQATVAARELALKRLEAAQSKADVGMATNYEVVQAQRDFADARNAELRAILNYRKAIVNFETVQRVGTRGVGAAVTGGGGGGGTATPTTGGGGQ